MTEQNIILDFVNEREKKNVGAWGTEGKKKQSILYSSRILVVGSDLLSQMILSNLVGLGIGSICCIDDSRISTDDGLSFLVGADYGDSSSDDNFRVTAIMDRLHMINPILNYYECTGRFTSGDADEFNADVIVDATNSPDSKNSCLEYCLARKVPFISASSNEVSGSLTYVDPNNLNGSLEEVIKQGFGNQRQGTYTSGVTAGLVVEQLRKLKFLIDDVLDAPLQSGHTLVYTPNGYPMGQHISYSDVSALVVGAGAIGNFAALNLALLGFGKVDIVDFDKIEDHNLNRQLLLYGRVGEGKANVLSERIREISAHTRSMGIPEGVDEKWSASDVSEYDILFGCVDNQRARASMNRLAVEGNLSYIDGGTSTDGGRVVMYVPKRNRCLDCQLSVSSSAAKEVDKNTEGCATNPEPAIVIPNIIIGSAMVAEFANLVNGTPRLLDKTFQYDTFHKNRFYLERQILSKCGLNCH